MQGGEVEVPRLGLSDISRALTKKRLDLVKVTNSLNEAPKGISDLLSQSRAFTDKLSNFLEDGSELSESVKQALLEEEGFPGQVSRLPLEQVFSDVGAVKEELRIADGYQPYLVSPEKGMRNLLKKALGKLIHPVNDLVDNVHRIVDIAAEKALNESCQVPGIGAYATPVTRFPNFIDSVMPVVTAGLLELKEEARAVAIKVVEMEKSFVSCSFFRYMTYKRIHDYEQKQKSNGVVERRKGGGVGGNNMGGGGIFRSKKPKKKGQPDSEDEDEDESDTDNATEEKPREAVLEEKAVTAAPPSNDMGLGSEVFWDKMCRDENNNLLPSPGVILDNYATYDADKALQQHMKDMKVYTKMVCETLVMTVPKVIIYCLIDRATEDLGPKIEEHILNLSKEARDQLLVEDPALSVYRDRIKKLVLEIGDSEEKIKSLQRQESESSNNQTDEAGDLVIVPYSIIELAGLTGRLSKTRNSAGNYTFVVRPPRAVRNTTPPPDPVKPQNPNSSRYPSSGPEGRKSENGSENGQIYSARVISNGPSQSGGGSRAAPRRPAPKAAVTASGRPLSPSPVASNATGPVLQTSDQRANKYPSQQQQQQQPQQQQSQNPQNWYTWKPFQK